MKHGDFMIGSTFYMSSTKWLCTGIGTRTIVAVRVDPGCDVSRLKGPPYALAEQVIDEYDFAACYRRKPKGW